MYALQAKKFSVLYSLQFKMGVHLLNVELTQLLTPIMSSRFEAGPVQGWSCPGPKVFCGRTWFMARSVWELTVWVDKSLPK